MTLNSFMSKPIGIKTTLTIVMTLCASGAQSLAAFMDSVPQPTLEVRHDTLHITPAMVEELQKNTPVQEFNMEMESVKFVPKGQWVAGVSVSYSQSTQNDYQFLILQNISGDTYSFKVSPMVCYIFKDDMGVGGKFQYTRSLTKLESADIVLDSETSYGADCFYSLSHNYFVTGIFRRYFSLGNSKRFGIFHEVQLKLGGGQSKLTNGAGQSLTGAYERNFQFGLGIAPGLAVFLSNYSALEVNVGVLGFTLTDTKSISDQVYVSRRKSRMANFRINLFSITFGVAFYL